jgi:hypothetical protein
MGVAVLLTPIALFGALLLLPVALVVLVVLSIVALPALPALFLLGPRATEHGSNHPHAPRPHVGVFST